MEAVRERHDGVRRNPWNEVECGNHYARSMSSWALLLALSGAQVDPSDGGVSFSPVSELLSKDEPFTTLWSNGRSWGTVRSEWDGDAQAWTSAIEVLGGEGA